MSGEAARFDLRPSWRYATIIVLVHGVGGLCFLTLLTGFAGITLGLLMLALGAAAARRQALLRDSRSLVRIELLPCGEATGTLANGQSVTLAAARSGVSRLWVALRSISGGRHVSLVVAGMLPDDGFRRLRLWALWRRVPGVVPGQRPA